MILLILATNIPKISLTDYTNRVKTDLTGPGCVK